MTERKKDYILDALGELEDDLVAEAATYTKPKIKWNYWRELGAAAACVVAVVVTIKTVEFLPINKSVESAVKTECATQVNVVQPESVQEAVKENASAETAVIEYERTPIANDVMESLKEEGKTYSEGIEWKVVENYQNKDSAQEQKVSDKITSGVTENVYTSIAERVDAEKILAQRNDIFRGIVTDLQVYQITGKINKHITVATVEVTDCIRGTLQVGEAYQIYLPIVVTEDTITTNSLAGNLEKLEVGSDAIFMPKTANKYTGLGKKDTGEWLCYADFADYYYEEGLRYLFLQTGDNVLYDKSTYEISSEDITLEDVAEYIRRMIDK